MPPKSKRTTSSKKKQVVKKGTRNQARFNFDKMRYYVNKAVFNANKKYSETKVIACNERNFDTPTMIGTINAAYKCYCLGAVAPSTWTGMPLTMLGGIATTQGDGRSQRTGDYLYLNKTHITMEIQANESVNGGDPEVELRVIVFKARRGVNPAGISYNPNNSIMIGDTGENTGPGILTESPFSLMTRPLNKRDYVILKDFRRRLGQTDINGLGGAYKGDRYSPSHVFSFDLPFNKKVKYSSGEVNEPIDIDFHYGIMILGRALGHRTLTYPGNDWCINLRGTTSFTDN